jgi:DNA-binding NarL/FixJ family response regulator
VLLHDLVRLDEAKTVLPRLVALQELVDGDFVPAYAAHADARVLRDGAGLEEVSGRFEQLGAILLATEAAAAATEAHGESGNERRAHAQARERARLQALSEAAHSPLLVTTEAAVPLTRRELEIALLAGAGLSSKVVAERLVVSVRTVDNHLQHVYAKLGVTNRAELEQTLRALGLSHGR